MSELSQNRQSPQNPNLDPVWGQKLQKLFTDQQMKSLRSFLQQEKSLKKDIFPPTSLTFNALNLTPFNSIKVVILGQDPYHGKGQAHGLCFSVPQGNKTPPSLRNIFTELKNDLGIERSKTDLSDWARQGVLLLNSVLTVEEQKPASHAKRGWEVFTDGIINMVAQERPHCAFILWGAYAQSKAGMINQEKHFIIESPHPSPFSADKGFFGSKPFSKVNAFLQTTGNEVINWGE